MPKSRVPKGVPLPTPKYKPFQIASPTGGGTLSYDNNSGYWILIYGYPALSISALNVFDALGQTGNRLMTLGINSSGGGTSYSFGTGTTMNINGSQFVIWVWGFPVKFLIPPGGSVQVFSNLGVPYALQACQCESFEAAFEKI